MAIQLSDIISTSGKVDLILRKCLESPTFCQTPQPNENPKDQFGFGVTLKSKRMYFKTFLLR